ncbi:MAG: DR2241 family protein, partial [Halobacteriota archaeon]
REWEYDEDTELGVDGGDGRFPCREPCSLVVTAARKWTKLEAEQERTYEFDLTPSEKAQVEAIIDAVADGEADDIREADIYRGANRYRARFLRAKRFDDEGRLCGVPAGED